MVMGRMLDEDELRDYIALNRELAKRAEVEGNLELAQELEQIAEDASLQLIRQS